MKNETLKELIDSAESMSKEEIKFGLSVGQQVTWRCELRGGYGRIIFVKATVVKTNPKRVRIEAELAKGGTKQVNVDYSNIKESNQYKPMLANGGN